MATGNIVKAELYMLSLWLLFFLIILVTVDFPVCIGDGCAFIDIKELLTRNIVPTVSLLCLLIGTFSYFRFRYRLSGSSDISSKIETVEDCDFEHLTFLTTYIIPLICFNLSSARYVIVLGILLVVIGFIYIRTDKFHSNPSLAVLGFRLHKVTLNTRTGSRQDIMVISFDRLKAGDLIRTRNIDSKFYFAKKESG